MHNGTEKATTTTLTFPEDTVLVIEVKSTLGGTKTPEFNSTQGSGIVKVERQIEKAEGDSGHWKHSNMLAVDPGALAKVATLRKAFDAGNIQCVHAQVFFDRTGQLNTQIGKGTGIQFNTW